MDVEAAEGADCRRRPDWIGIKHPLRQHQAIGRHHHHIRRGLVDGVLRRDGVAGESSVQAQTARLLQAQLVAQCQLFYRRLLQRHASARRPIGLREHQRYLMSHRQQLAQCDCGEFRRAGEYDPQSRSPRWSLRILVRIRLRLSGDKYSTNTLPNK